MSTPKLTPLSKLVSQVKTLLKFLVKIESDLIMVRKFPS